METLKERVKVLLNYAKVVLICVKCRYKMELGFKELKQHPLESVGKCPKCDGEVWDLKIGNGG